MENDSFFFIQEVFLLGYFFYCLSNPSCFIFFPSLLIFLNVCFNVTLLVLYYWFLFYFLPSKNLRDIKILYKLFFKVSKWFFSCLYFYLIKYFFVFVYQINFLSNPLIHFSSFLFIFYIFFSYFLFRQIIFFLVPKFYSKYPKLFFDLNYSDLLLYLIFIILVYVYYHYNTLYDCLGFIMPTPPSEDKEFIDFVEKYIPDIEELLKDEEFLKKRPDLK